VDGVNIAEALDDWRRYIGYVPQSVYLFDASILDNITFGQKIDTRAQARLRTALEAAQLEPMLDRLPMGLDTVVGENGARISGGEKQRIGIARALFREPSLLIMDEPTSALDAGTEAAFTDALRCLSHRFTLIVVAHRLSTIGFCDQILEMKNGALRDVTLAHRGTLESGATQ
jgi:ABC-type multidrug transport system fused ATPase/permease subunit